MTMTIDRFAKCPHCGGPLENARPAPPEREAAAKRDPRWDIAVLLAEAARDGARRQ